MLLRISRTRGIVEYSCSQVPEERSMSREYVYFLSHAPTGSLCSLGSLRSLSVISHVRFNTKEKPNQKKRSCPPSQQRTLRPFLYTSVIRQQAPMTLERKITSGGKQMKTVDNTHKN